MFQEISISIRSFASNQKKIGPWLAMTLLLLVTIYLLRNQGRMWLCSCGYIRLWVGDIWSSDNSQHILDPYAFSHLLHGFIFFWLLAWAFPRLSPAWQLWLALFIEAAWEVLENSAFIINRYREATLALGYQGDTILNSVSDILVCGLGFMLARWLGFRRSFALLVVIELILLVWIRDNLTLNVLMLLYPIDAIRTWQMGG